MPRRRGKARASPGLSPPWTAAPAERRRGRPIALSAYNRVVSVPGEALQQKLDALPDRPGVYRFYSSAGKIIYVGKAKNLKNRVRSYFRPSADHPPKVAAMVAEAADLDTIVLDTEFEAFLLENHLVKKERPRYNVVLRDDKNYPYLKLAMQDEYPRVTLVRRARLDGNRYFGPFLPASVAWNTLRMIPRFFRVAICHVKFDGKQRPCLYYHLGQCLAPCAGHTNPEEYGRAVAEARLFLEGRNRELGSRLAERMQQAAEREEFEQAAHYRDLIRTIERLSERQAISSVGLEDQDFLAHYREGEKVSLQIFQMREGKVQSRREFHFEGVGADPASFYAQVLGQYYATEESLPSEIYLAEAPADAALLERWLSERRGATTVVSAPRRGVKREFLDVVAENARLAFEQRFRAQHVHGVTVLEEVRDLLGLDEPPYRIEAFDISNLQGTDSVASMVVWEGGKPKKSDYRRYKIRTVEGSDDFRSIAEAVGRRYARLKKENARLPDLVLIDGGKGQLSSAVAALDQIGLGEIPVASIAKREEEIFVEGRGVPIVLAADSPVLRLVQRIRDEAHRFAVTYHRKRRDMRTFGTELTEIAGVGRETARRLLRIFGSVEGVRAAGESELAGAVGPKLAAAIRARFAPGAPLK
jgi:excinuclease ABC subunit C